VCSTNLLLLELHTLLHFEFIFLQLIGNIYGGCEGSHAVLCNKWTQKFYDLLDVLNSYEPGSGVVYD